MRLRSKLLIVILISILFQVLVSGFFTIQTFLRQSETSSEEQLHSAWRRARFYIEKLKHSSFIHLLSLSQYIQDNSELDAEALDRTIRYLKSDIEVDQLAVLGPDNRLILEISMAGSGSSPGFSRNIAADLFSHPTSRFMHLGNGALYLITGTWIYRGAEKLAFICLIKAIDHALLTIMKQELDSNLAIFAGDRYMCSDIPPFLLAEGIVAGEVHRTDTSTGSYSYLAKVLSSDIEEKLYLVSLKSTLDDRIYTAQLLRSFFVAFLITLLVAIVLAVSMTTYFVSPFARLQRWIEGYRRDGSPGKLTVKTKDEVGFLATAFHQLATKLIGEEQVIRQQLEEISFLHRYNENILKNLQAGVLVVNSGGQVEYCNDYITRLLEVDREQVLGTAINTVLATRFSAPEELFESLAQGRYAPAESIVRSRDLGQKFSAKTIPLRVSEREQKILVVLEDISGTERLWEKMAQAEKLASLGLLSAGMAHEINNPLGSILSHVQYLSTVENDKEKRDSLKWIEREATRIARIVERLRSFARNDASDGEPADMNRIVADTVQLLEHELVTEDIEICRELQADLPPVKLSFQSLEQVVLNLLVNSVQAIEQSGQIRIQTSRLGDRAELTVSDNGKGIPEQELGHVFDPFFTTKSGGAGMGLGLAICYDIISRAGGQITIKSSGGTTVTVLLPLESVP